MKTIMTFLFCLSLIPGISQQINYKNSFKLSAGRILFGTGDIPGYGANIEYSRCWTKHLLIGTELSFENGSTQPKVINPTLSDFFLRVITQQQTLSLPRKSLTILSLKQLRGESILPVVSP